MPRNFLTGTDLPLASRIQRSAFALAMIIVVVIGSISIALSLREIPIQDEEAHTATLRIISERFSADIGNRLANQAELSRSPLVWTALTDSEGRDAYQEPFLASRAGGNQGMLLLDYRGRPIIGQLKSGLSDSHFQGAIAAASKGHRPEFAVQEDPPMLIAAYPVYFPDSDDVIGMLVGLYDLGAIFRNNIAGLGEGHGIILSYGSTDIARMPGEATPRHYPARISITDTPDRMPAGLALELYGTNSDDWLNPILTRLAVYLGVGLFFALLAWKLARRVAQSLTHRLNHLATACEEVAAGRPFLADEDSSPDEIGLLSRTLRRAIQAHEEINANLERLVEQKTQALNESLERYRQSFEVNSAIKLVVDRESGEIFDANTAAVRFYGYSREELLGLPVTAINCLSPEEIKVKMAEAAAGSQQRFLFRHRLASGEIRDVEVHSGPISIAGRQYLHSIIHDVTERRLLEVELENHRQHLENLISDRTADLLAANKELQGFTYAASHDLKAPLGRINSFSTLLERNYRARLEGDGLMFLDLIRRNAIRMMALIEDLLDHARIEQRILDLQPVNLKTAMEAVLTDRAEDIREAGVEIRLDLPVIMVRANPQGLAQVLRNLLDNALKYSAGAKPALIEIGGSPEGGGYRLWIRDNGVGFDMMYHDRIFEIFRRLHTYEEFPGSGVGLALVKKAVERMGGQVWAESQPGQGATFYVELPV